jgi:hypothetical protein
MFPDIDDVSKVMCKLSGVTRPSPEAVWPQAVLLRGFLEFSYRWCRNHGRHGFTLATELKPQAEDFIGKSVTDYEFCLGLFLNGPMLTRLPFATPFDVTTFKLLEIRFPPTHRLEEGRARWKEIQLVLEREIAQERERLAQQAEWLAANQK